MNRHIHSSCILLLVATIFSGTTSSQAMSIYSRMSQAIPIRIVSCVKNFFRPVHMAQVKDVVLKVTSALWTAAKVTAVVTVLVNICMPRARTISKNRSFFSRFLFNADPNGAQGLNPSLLERIQNLEAGLTRLQQQQSATRDGSSSAAT